jgi:hypothetical protein
MAQASRVGDDDASTSLRTRRVMRIGEVIVGLLVLVAVASYGFVAAITLAK